MYSRLVRQGRVIAVASALLAVSATLAPAALAEGTGGTADPADRTDAALAARLAAADASVLKADVAGTAWYTDTASGKLVVTADRTVDAAGISAIEDAVNAPEGELVINREPGAFTKLVAGGDTITTPEGLRCTVGFNVEDGDGVKYALTAGHCTNVSATWSIGPTVDSSFPGNDYGLIRYTDPSRAEGGVRGPGGVLLDITTAGDAKVGQSVQRAGSTTGVHSGTVTGLNASVNYGDEGIVTGLIQTTVCAEAGDSGGPLYAGTTALGLTSGGSGDCTSGGTTFFQPVTEPLSAYGVNVF